MTTDLELLAESNREKARRTIDLVVASLSEYRPFNPAATYTPKDLEPYDAPWLIASYAPWNAACAIFAAMNCSNSQNNPTPPAAFSTGWKSQIWLGDTTLWLQMRNVRNRIVHDYLPEQTAQMHSKISGPYGKELQRIRGLPT